MHSFNSRKFIILKKNLHKMHRFNFRKFTILNRKFIILNRKFTILKRKSNLLTLQCINSLFFRNFLIINLPIILWSHNNQQIYYMKIIKKKGLIYRLVNKL